MIGTTPKLESQVSLKYIKYIFSFYFRRLPICSPGIRSFLFKRFSSESSKGSSEDGTLPGNKKESTPADTPNNEVTDRINMILKGMVEDNAKRGSESFKSKFPNENKGMKSQKEKLALKGNSHLLVILFLLT